MAKKRKPIDRSSPQEAAADKVVAECEAALEQPTRIKSPIPSKDLLGSGSTLLDLACTNRIAGAFPKGHYILYVGDSQSGKTFLARTCLAEATINKHFTDYRLIYDDIEGGSLMQIEHFFGKIVVDKLELPGTDDEGEPCPSRTIEDMYFYIDDALKDDRPFIYIVDSMDSLTSNYDEKKFYERKNEARGGRKAAGDFGDGKAAYNSRNLRKVRSDLKAHGSILIIICQTRDNINAGPWGESKTFSGGWALKFYACMEIWTSVRKKIKKQIKGVERMIGVVVKIRVKKNRITGQEHTIEVPIYHNYGIDDVRSCIEFLLETNHWTMRGKTIAADELGLTGPIEILIKDIELGDHIADLRETVGQVWQEIQDAMATKRKPRYARK